MPNTIALAKNYVALLDEVYKVASVTEGLTSAPEVLRAGTNADTVLYPQVSMNGLTNYSRANGYTANAVTVQWKEAQYNYDRGTKIAVDVMDNQESMNIAFGRVGGELMRTKVAPEADAFTFATLAGKTGVQSEAGTFTDGVDLLEALYTATVAMDEEEVDAGRVLYITPTLIKLVNMLETIKSREILGYFSQVVTVPQNRFYTAITLAASGVGGYSKASGAKDINFMVVEPGAVIKGDKHIVSDIIPASLNPDADQDIMKYRKYGIVDVFANKVKGIYFSYKG